MARSELLRKLFQTYRRGDNEGFNAVALEVIADEKRKNHHQLAADLTKIMNNGVSLSSPRSDNFDRLPKDKERQLILVEPREPQLYFDDIVLSKTNKQAMLQVIKENKYSEILHSYGMQPKKKVLFCGPPGCGKTLAAEVLSGELSIPLLYARFDAIVSSYLGETSANIRKIFDYAAGSTWIILFDEFDAIGKSRSSREEHGELKRVVNSFLQILDNFKSDSIVIAATNHEGLLDSALWRRFDEVLYFDRPDKRQIEALLERKLRSYPHSSLSVKGLAQNLVGLSHADVERICYDAIKDSILMDKPELDKRTFSDSANRQLARLKIVADIETTAELTE